VERKLLFSSASVSCGDNIEGRRESHGEASGPMPSVFSFRYSSLCSQGFVATVHRRKHFTREFGESGKAGASVSFRHEISV
jgi:hypothetical protein